MKKRLTLKKGGQWPIRDQVNVKKELSLGSHREDSRFRAGGGETPDPIMQRLEKEIGGSEGIMTEYKLDGVLPSLRKKKKKKKRKKRQERLCLSHREKFQALRL